jgi:hypothetical protein
MLEKVLEGLDYNVSVDDFHNKTEIKITSNKFDIPEMDRIVKLWEHFNTLNNKEFNSREMVELEHNLRAEENKILLDIKVEYFDDIVKELYKYKVSNNILFNMYEQTVAGPNAIYTSDKSGFIVASSFFLEVELVNGVYTDWNKRNTSVIELKKPNQNQIYSFNIPKEFDVISAKWITQAGNVGEL